MAKKEASPYSPKNRQVIQNAMEYRTGFDKPPYDKRLEKRCELHLNRDKSDKRGSLSLISEFFSFTPPQAMSSLPRTGDQEDANKPQGYIIRTSTYSGALPMGDTDWTSLSSSPYTFQRAKSFSQKKEKDNTPSPYHAKILQNRSNTSEEMTLEQQAAQSKRCQRCFKTKKEDPSWGHLTQKELSVRVFCIIRTQ